MDWIPPVSTLAGAVVGVGSALIAERIRWRREKEKETALTRRGVYCEFLMALSQSHSDMRAVVLGGAGSSPEARYGQLHQALDGSGIWRVRQSLSLTAPAEIIQLAVSTCDALTGVRDVLIETPDVRSERYLRSRADLWHVNAGLRESMRRDLGMDGLPDPEVGRYRYPAPP
ncbi:hypothetical protein [Streptomyces sp. PvR034]|uniref:hypothetical protein n=1 Tax=Streptomyces sp. PvR034 TaxID=3156401 RepID=UPI00339ACF84